LSAKLASKRLAPALIDSIKTAGLVLISDISGTSLDMDGAAPGPISQLLPEGVDGTLRSNGVLGFTDSVDM
jgi:CDK inhibitor PHO81